ncbi:hypothetical protein L7F22_017619 [Adiantum nelumboides]|nr:hypothetical protein [Adiantum nelumboides]
MPMGSTVLQLVSGPTGNVAKVHPTVLFNICDSFIRRNDQTERVIGTLLGSVSSDGTVDIRNSYAVPHNESLEQVFIKFSLRYWKGGSQMLTLVMRSDQT